MLLEFDLKPLEIGPDSSFFQFLDFISAFTVNLEIWTASWQQFVKLHEKFCTNSGCQSRLNLILNLITAQINHLKFLDPIFVLAVNLNFFFLKNLSIIFFIKKII